MLTTEQVATITVELPFDQASAFAQFFKRVGHSDYRPFGQDVDEPYEMRYAAVKLRDALIVAGVAPE